MAVGVLVSDISTVAYSTMHLFNHWLAIHSQDVYDNALLALRELYQHPAAEMAGAATLALHIYAGKQLPSTAKSSAIAARFQRYTG
eukprot:m.32246 g.32246  ORF g.32246 m.32246 type:complete len:86 (+) comp12141_c0_seq1:43-300(+)